ncbi:hypothetical protein B5C34_00160 [Pacificimonas flava]|uniref:VOC domain-containing protein n=2 Tax=Pacificimonas TaxID=1960290 RepID=A0A219B1M8_9SPHN|nr:MULTISPECIES: VOC family protein [Pacificimonas]MBZ6380057.1 hypothetical protein [Pacificimonas aurantium]OWV32026.1 hypothetical protein B5C34_00160 [Pacificimonas flava]
MSAPIVFFDIAGPDFAAQRDFYSAIFGWEIGEDGRFTTGVVAPTVDALLRTDPADKMIYVGVEDVAATLKLVEEKGGTVDLERREVPGMIVLGLFRDPAGNHMGLVEMKDGEQVIP